MPNQLNLKTLCSDLSLHSVFVLRSLFAAEERKKEVYPDEKIHVSRKTPLLLRFVEKMNRKCPYTALRASLGDPENNRSVLMYDLLLGTSAST